MTSASHASFRSQGSDEFTPGYKEIKTPTQLWPATPSPVAVPHLHPHWASAQRAAAASSALHALSSNGLQQMQLQQQPQQQPQQQLQQHPQHQQQQLMVTPEQLQQLLRHQQLLQLIPTGGLGRDNSTSDLFSAPCGAGVAPQRCVPERFGAQQHQHCGPCLAEPWAAMMVGTGHLMPWQGVAGPAAPSIVVTEGSGVQQQQQAVMC